MINWNDLKIIARYSASHSNWKLLLDVLYDMQDKEILTHEQRAHIYDILTNNALAKRYPSPKYLQQLLHSDMVIRLS